MSFELLKSHDLVDIIAPASRCPQDDLEKVQQFLASWNLNGRIPADLFGNDLFSSNTDDIRFKHLQEALAHADSKVIWCLRGGYGSSKLIPLLMKIKPPVKQKIFIGSSDITALHIFFQCHWKWTTIHGPSIHSAALKKTAPESLDLLKNLLFQKTNSITIEKMIPLNSAAKKPAKISAPVIGGNLSLIQASLGTEWQIDTAGKILFIEETNERAYRIDRILTQLKQAGVFTPAKAILLGDFIGGQEPNGHSLVAAALNIFAQSCNIPVIQITGIGHGFINNPLLLGNVAQLHTGENSTFVNSFPV